MQSVNQPRLSCATHTNQKKSGVQRGHAWQQMHSPIVIVSATVPSSPKLRITSRCARGGAPPLHPRACVRPWRACTPAEHEHEHERRRGSQFHRSLAAEQERTRGEGRRAVVRGQAAAAVFGRRRCGAGARGSHKREATMRGVILAAEVNLLNSPLVMNLRYLRGCALGAASF